MNKKHPALFLMGPTAIGKSAFALKLAEQLPIEIISVDSAMVYRGMDIGTGKPTLQERTAVPHHLLDIRDPADPYSAAEFAKEALQKMFEIRGRNAIPALVGGTFLYFKALQHGLSQLPSADPTIREHLLAEAKVLGWAALHQRLTKVDPHTALRLHPNDTQRIQRALEVYEITKRPMSDLFEVPHSQGVEGKKQLGLEGIEEFDIKAFALIPEDRAVLHKQIEVRFFKMLDQGLVKEVEALFQRGDLNINMPSIRAVGYRQMWMYLQGALVYDQMVFKAVAATRQLAKRQLTWLRSLSDLQLLQNSGLGSLNTVIHSLFDRGIS